MNEVRHHNFFRTWIIAFGIYAGSVPVASAQHFDPDNQLLWQISGKGLRKPSYLYGSYHSNDNRLFKFSDSTYSALLNADAIVLEADIYSLFAEYDPRIANITLSIDGAGKPYTSDKKPSLTKYGSEDGRPQFLDAYFQQVAYNAGKKFFALESVEEQLQAYENITYHNFREYSLNALSMTQENILQTYLRGDIESMRQILRSQLSISGNAYNLLITNRNVTMANGIDSLCRKQSLFVAVGAAHLAGSEGIIQLLRSKGYTLRQVSASFADAPTPAEISLRRYNSYTYEDPVRGFTAVFGGKPKIDSSARMFRLIYQEMGQGNTFWIEVSRDDSPLTLSSRIDEFFTTPNNTRVKEIRLPNDVQAFEGLTNIYGTGDCWRRVFIYRNQVFKITCFGGNKFMNSDRYLKFFNRITLH